jgi:hypothetical protein
MPLMNIFEPLFLLLALLMAGSLLAAAAMAVTGRFARAGRILTRLLVGAAAYFAVVVAVSILAPRRIHALGEAQCFDDWCITVVAGARAGTAPDARYLVSFRLSSRAKRVPMGEKGTVVYLTDDGGNRYDPIPDPSDVALDTVLQPGQSVAATRRFAVPASARGLGFVYTHEGGFPIGWLIIGEGGWFARPPIVRME